MRSSVVNDLFFSSICEILFTVPTLIPAIFAISFCVIFFSSLFLLNKFKTIDFLPSLSPALNAAVVLLSIFEILFVREPVVS